MTIYSRREFAQTHAAIGPRLGIYRNYFKRSFDILFVLLVAIPVAIIVTVLAGLVALEGGNPIYRQKRVGRNGKVFEMFKLRSMVPDADDLLETHLASDPMARKEWDHYQKLRNDPRITRLGRFVRVTSLDELPQFWNVLVGDMSLVGPRPMMVDQLKLYPGSAYFSMRPGITGFWQISERNESSFTERAFHDSNYDGSLCLATDVSVILRTVAVVLHGTGV